MPAIGKRIQFADFVGPSYPAKSPFVSVAQAMNLYPEKVPGIAGGKSQYSYYNTPGTQLLGSLAIGPMQCAYTIPGEFFAADANRMFFIAGDSDLKNSHLYEVNAAPTFSVVDRGALFQAAGFRPRYPWQISNNGSQLLIVGGDSFDGNIFDLLTDTITQITASGWVGASSIAFLDGYFIAVDRQTQTFRISGLLDGLSWDPLDFATENDIPDSIVAVAVDHRRVWFFGEVQIEGYYDSGNADFPFTRDQSAVIQVGLAAQSSLCSLDNTLYWLGKDMNGANVAYRMNGLTGERVSTYAQEAVWNSYPGDGINTLNADAVGFAYQENGHTFFVLSFPTEGTQWVYDVGEQLWHERGRWDAATGKYVAPFARYHTYNPGVNRHYVGGGDVGTHTTPGNIYLQSQDIYQDNGGVIRRVRRSGYINDRNQRIFCGRFELQMETGTTQLLDGAGNPRQAQISMRFSDDNGRNYSPEQTVNCGALGQYAQSVYWTRQGSFLQRVYEVVYTEPTPLAITNAFLELSEVA
jgi:hypothetical protein